MLTEEELIKRATGRKGAIGSKQYQKWRLARKALGLQVRPPKLPKSHRRQYMREYMAQYRKAGEALTYYVLPVSKS